MELMFLPVLIVGFVYLWIDGKMPMHIKGMSIYTWFTYTLHTSIALIVNRMLVTGILQIAGTDTDKLIIFDFSAGIFLLAATLFFWKLRKRMAR